MRQLGSYLRLTDQPISKNQTATAGFSRDFEITPGAFHSGSKEEGRDARHQTKIRSW
jgi:hypothetical protein